MWWCLVFFFSVSILKSVALNASVYQAVLCLQLWTLVEKVKFFTKQLDCSNCSINGKYHVITPSKFMSFMYLRMTLVLLSWCGQWVKEDLTPTLPLSVWHSTTAPKGKWSSGASMHSWEFGTPGVLTSAVPFYCICWVTQVLINYLLQMVVGGDNCHCYFTGSLMFS